MTESEHWSTSYVTLHDFRWRTFLRAGPAPLTLVSLVSGTNLLSLLEMNPPPTDVPNSSKNARLGRYWFYLSQVLSIIGLAGILDDLTSWLKFVTWGMARVRGFSPDLSAFLVWIGGAIRSVVALWRQVLHPVVDWALGWLPFHVPILVKDLLLVLLFVVIGWSRANSLWSGVWTRRRARVSEIAKEFGSEDRYPYVVSVRAAKEYIENCRKDRSTLKPYEQSSIERLETALGENSLAFANRVVHDPIMLALEAEGDRALFVLEPLLKGLVIVGATIVVVFIVVDLFLG
ncbi:MAG TPA: hypothetical protein VFX98_04345 [Longimicrobiaceae bacterium]|nr:hypothetical protein [Longimicrobiaceae bacterium]